jgi:hypothetical protein
LSAPSHRSPLFAMFPLIFVSSAYVPLATMPGLAAVDRCQPTRDGGVHHAVGTPIRSSLSRSLRGVA